MLYDRFVCGLIVLVANERGNFAPLQIRTNSLRQTRKPRSMAGLAERPVATGDATGMDQLILPSTSSYCGAMIGVFSSSFPIRSPSAFEAGGKLLYIDSMM